MCRSRGCEEGTGEYKEGEGTTKGRKDADRESMTSFQEDT